MKREKRPTADSDNFVNNFLESESIDPRIKSKIWNEKISSKYELSRVVGKGSYGEVMSGVDGKGRKVAIKRLCNMFDFDNNLSDAKRIYRELRVLRHLKHNNPYIITLLSVYCPQIFDPANKRMRSNSSSSTLSTSSCSSSSASSSTRLDLSDLYLVFEWMDTDLYKVILSPQYLSIEHVQSIIYQLLMGVKAIHDVNVIHRDLKPANVLLNEDCSLKVL